MNADRRVWKVTFSDQSWVKMLGAADIGIAFEQAHREFGAFSTMETLPETDAAVVAALDHGMLNVPLARRGNIDSRLDAYKREQAKLAKQEHVRDFSGIPHLCKGDFVRVFANRTQAEKAAARTGGEAYQSPLSNRFMVRFVA